MMGPVPLNKFQKFINNNNNKYITTTVIIIITNTECQLEVTLSIRTNFVDAT